MNNNIYKFAALMIFLILLAAAIYIYRPNQDKLTRVTVVGDSKTQIAPDTAVITFSVVTQAKQAVDAQQENARKSEAVRQAVMSLTANSNPEVKTSDYNLSPEQDYYSGKMPKILGYEVKNTVTVSTTDLTQVGAVVDAATRAGANSVQGIQFVVGEASPAQGEALALATKQAMAKAEAIAKSLNGRIVRIVETNEGGVPVQTQRDRYESTTIANAAALGLSEKKYETPVQPGSLNVRSTVILVVDIAI